MASVEAARLGIAEPIGELYYSFEYNFFGAGFGDHDDPMGKSWLFFHGSDGRLLGQEVAGQGSWESVSTACSTRSTAGASPACRDASPSPPSAWPSPGCR